MQISKTMVHQIQLVTQNNIYFVAPGNVLYCKSNNSSTTFFLTDKSSVVISKGIKAVVQMLNSNDFIRPHQSYLVNKNHIIRVNKSDGYTLVLSNSKEIPTSVRRRKEIIKALNPNNKQS